MQRIESPDSPLDHILLLNQYAGSAMARKLLRQICDGISQPGNVPRWASAIQIARDLGTIGSAESYALLDIVTEHAMLIVAQTDPELCRHTDAMRRIARADGLADDEDYLLHEAPAEWLAINQEWERRFAHLRADLFRQIGEPGMADDVLLHQEEFEARSGEGRSFLFDADD